ncbi:MAG: Ig domain-containing protein [Faecousia sp.]
MSKIICEVCGTSFPDTASQCPICGSVHTAAAMGVGQTDETREEREFVPTRGGRFSRSNVKKRNAAMNKRYEEEDEETEEAAAPVRTVKSGKSGKKSKSPAFVVLLLLLVAALAVGAYFGVSYLREHPEFSLFPKGTTPVATKPQETPPAGTTPVQTDPVQTTAPVPTGVPCTELRLSDSSLEFTAVGKAWMLGVEVEPLDTTDEVTFASSNEEVATVTEMGRIVAVAPGEASIWVVCGDVVQECKVICSFDPVEPTDLTEPTEPSETAPQVDSVKLSHTDVTIKVGEGFTITAKGIDTALLKFDMGNNGVATITEAGYIKGVGKGTTTLTVTYNDMSATCTIRVK